MAADAAKTMWDAYQSGYARQQEAMMFEAELTLDMFDSPEDIERSIDIIEAAAGFSIAVYEAAVIFTSASPPVGAVVLAIGGVAWAGRAIYRACQ